MTDAAAGSEQKAVAEVIPPRFDIVRVEPNGNVVIAGNAASEATVEVITGTRVLGDTKSGTEGDFAVVLSEPLDPGDYTIVLRATSLDNTVAMSTETAIVSVPETESGEVLAIVDEPGKPSKLITVPEAEETTKTEPDDSDTQVAAADTATDKAAESASETESETAETATGGSEVESAAQTETENGESADVVANAEPEVTNEDTTASEAESEDEGKSGTEMAVAEADDITEAPTDLAAAMSIAVEAVEIEGDNVFVAGTANPGKIVRVYANKDLIGETKSSDVGRFLVESARGLAVGEYIIRADMLEVGSADVIARAAVPFEREAGETIAAVARQDEAEEQGGANDASETTVPVETDDQPDGAGTEIASAETGEQATGSENQDATDDTTENGSAAVAESAEVMSGADNQKVGDTVKDSDSSTAASGDAEDSQSGEKTQTEVAAAEPGDIDNAEFDNDVALTAPKLEKTSGSVIIRRGDTLWHISRRVYGRGIRYTTIYTANRDQIENPDRIWPGQIFDVPGVSDEGEAGDLEAIADQAPETAGN